MQTALQKTEQEERAYKIGVCNDCGGHTQWYIVKDSLWIAAWPTYLEERSAIRRRHGPKNEQGTRLCLELCLTCLEKRMGRPLELADFPDVPINSALMAGYRLGLAEAQRKNPDNSGDKKGEGA